MLVGFDFLGFLILDSSLEDGSFRFSERDRLESFGLVRSFRFGDIVVVVVVRFGREF